MKKNRQVRPGLSCLVISLEAEDLGFQNENHRHSSSLSLSHYFVLWLLGCSVHLTLCDPLSVAHQAILSIGFFRQECWCGLPFSSSRGSSWPGEHCRQVLYPLSHSLKAIYSLSGPAHLVFLLPVPSTFSQKSIKITGPSFCQQTLPILQCFLCAWLPG